MNEIINKDLQLGYENYKKAYEMINQQYEDLLLKSQKDKKFLRDLAKDMIKDVNNSPDLKVSVTKLARYVGKIGQHLNKDEEKNA